MSMGRSNYTPFVKWLLEQIKRSDGSVYQMAQRSGIANGTLHRWIWKGMEPSNANVKRLAEYFGVEQWVIMELLGRVEKTGDVQATEEELLWLRLYRSLTLAERRQIRRMIAALREEPEQQQEEEPRPLPGRKLPNVPEK
jgi:hypothetical protein